MVGISVGGQRLLAFLALQDHLLSRQHVAATLWPQVSDAKVRANLRAALSGLDESARRAVMVTARDLGLAEGVVIDVRQSRELARRLTDRDAELQDRDLSAPSVLALSDDLLPGWYDDWAVIAAEDWHQLRLHALEAMAARLTAADRLAEAASAARAAVQAEPLRESARASLIGVHLAEGNHSAAVGEFERYRALLRAELDLEPTDRLRWLLSGLQPRAGS